MTAAPLISMLKRSSVTRSLRNSAPIAVVVEDDKVDDGSGGEMIKKSVKSKHLDFGKDQKLPKLLELFKYH